MHNMKQRLQTDVDFLLRDGRTKKLPYLSDLHSGHNIFVTQAAVPQIRTRALIFPATALVL